jgi:hypothetical protein
MIGGCWSVLLRLNEGRIVIIIRGNDAGLGLYNTVRLGCGVNFWVLWVHFGISG